MNDSVKEQLLVPAPHPATPILNPSTGTHEFGRFPEINSRHVKFPAGPIVLRHGQHRGPNSGFGLVHIWKEHFPVHDSVDQASSHVIGFIQNILRPGSKIHYESELGRRANRPLVWRNREGTAILELREDTDGPVYSIVTAFRSRGPVGFQIGSL
ncbi:hypothetical protein [Novimethylophilus kurashikiensis]|uniref:hypothetical protein n=1 Tax=Novimethylophilus kurashikiensis TaxID=1825523 RepID=UPI0011B29039|nr:hypothetical protein [Novimethylophilus kurashikiensis]